MYVITILLIIILNITLHPQVMCFDNETGIKYTKNRAKYCFIIGLWFFLLLVLRNDYVGTDTQNYHYVFDVLSWQGGIDLSFKDADISTEYGFYYLNHLIILCGLPFRTLLIISAFLYVGVISYLIYKYSQHPWLSYFIFLTFGFFIFNTAMRQCFAVSFCTIAFLFAIQKKLLPYLFFVIIACLFHSTALIFFPVYFLIKLGYNKKSYYIILVLGATIVFFSSWIFQYAIEITVKNYKEVETYGYGSLILFIMLVGIGYIYRNKLPYFNKYWLFLLLIGICLFPVSQLNPALFRINMYFRIFIIIYAANIVSLRVSISPIIIIFLLMFGTYQFVIGSKLAGIRVYPYVFYWENYYEINPDARKLNLM